MSMRRPCGYVCPLVSRAGGVLAVFCIMAALAIGAPTLLAAQSSVRITGITIEPSSLNRFANRGDLFPITWADDGNLYTAGGDGDGWDGTDTRGMDIDRLTGLPTGDLAANGIELFSKTDVLPKGIISVDGVLYIAEQSRSDFIHLRIGRSTDHGLTWTYPAGTDWDYSDLSKNAFTRLTFVQYGQDYVDGPAYVYMLDVQSDDGSGSLFDELILARAPRQSVDDVSTHEYFSGTATSPSWAPDPSDRKPIFRRPGAIHWGPTIAYNPKLSRYLLAFFTDQKATLAVYEAPSPWGPWAKIHEKTLVDATEKHMVNFVNKDGWLSSDGRTWWFVTSGVNAWDSFNVLKATLSISTSRRPTPHLRPRRKASRSIQSGAE